MQELQVRSLGWEDPLLGGHGNSLRYSCLENLMDRGAWRAKVHRITKRWTWLKWEHAHMQDCVPRITFPREQGSGFYRASDQSKSRQYWFAALHLYSGTMTMFMTSCVSQPPFVMTVRMFGFVCTELCCEYVCRYSGWSFLLWLLQVEVESLCPGAWTTYNNCRNTKTSASATCAAISDTDTGSTSTGISC